MKKIKIVSDGGPQGIQVFNAETGEPIENVRAVEYSAVAGELPEATLIYNAPFIEATISKALGIIKELPNSVILADGSRWLRGKWLAQVIKSDGQFQTEKEIGAKGGAYVFGFSPEVLEAWESTDPPRSTNGKAQVPSSDAGKKNKKGGKKDGE